MLILGKKAEPQKIILREAVPPSPAVRKGKKIVTPATDGEPEAFIRMAPITPAMRRRAHRAVIAVLGIVEDISDVDMDTYLDAAEKGSREIIRLGALEWGGIGGSDGGPVELTPDRETRFATANAADRPTGTIDLLLDDEDYFAKIEAEYVKPDALRRAAKNGLSASLNGTGGAGTQANAIASSPARRTGKKRAAKSARTARTHRKAKPKKTSGRR